MFSLSTYFEAPYKVVGIQKGPCFPGTSVRLWEWRGAACFPSATSVLLSSNLSPGDWLEWFLGGASKLWPMGQVWVGVYSCMACKLKVMFVLLNRWKTSKEGYFMTCENDMKLQFPCVNSILLAHGHTHWVTATYGSLPASISTSGGCQSDPRAWKAWNVYCLILYRKKCWSLAFVHKSLSLFSLSLKNGALLWSSEGGDDGIGALWSLGSWLNLLPVNPRNITLFPSLWASLCSLCCPSMLRATNDPPCPQGLVTSLSCGFPTLCLHLCQ